MLIGIMLVIFPVQLEHLRIINLLELTCYVVNTSYNASDKLHIMLSMSLDSLP